MRGFFSSQRLPGVIAWRHHTGVVSDLIRRERVCANRGAGKKKWENDAKPGTSRGTRRRSVLSYFRTLSMERPSAKRTEGKEA